MYAVEHEDPQLIPRGLLVTVPPAEPPIATVRVKLEAVLSSKTAVTDVSEVRAIVQGPAPLHPPPLQPVKADVSLGAAVSVTSVPLVKLPVQVVLQAIPVGLLVTVPLPLPELVTLSVAIGGPMAKVWAAEVPPPGTGVTTVTWAVPAVTMSLASIAV